MDVPDGHGGVAYMYVEGQILVQDTYVKEVFTVQFNPSHGAPTTEQDSEQGRFPACPS